MNTKGGEFTKDISSGKKKTNYKWIKKGHRSFCHASPPCTHDRNEYLLSEIPPPRSPSPGGTSAHQNAIHNTVHTLCVLHTSGPPTDRERWVILLCKDKNKISLYGQHIIYRTKPGWPKHIKVSFKITKSFQTCARVKALAGKRPKPIFRDWSKSITGFSTSRAKHLLPSHFVAENHRYVADW